MEQTIVKGLALSIPDAGRSVWAGHHLRIMCSSSNYFSIFQNLVTFKICGFQSSILIGYFWELKFMHLYYLKNSYTVEERPVVCYGHRMVGIEEWASYGHRL